MTTTTTPAQAREAATTCYDLDMGGLGAVICSLADQVEALTAELEEWRFTNKLEELGRHAERMTLERDIAKADAERFAFWFSDRSVPPGYITEYMRGMSESWGVEQWRMSIDAARGAA